MAERMLKFVSHDQIFPEKRSADTRSRDFDEIYRLYARNKAAEQAARCSQCGIPFCQIHCPLGNNIPDWLQLAAEGRLEEAYLLSSATNSFPEICGRICPHDRLCEGNCVIEKGFESVTIGAIERYITDSAFAAGLVAPPVPLRERIQSVGIVGAGPAGLAAADRLRRQGYQIEIYDRYDRVGGLLVYGIPNFKLEKDIVFRRQRLLEEAGVTFHLQTEIGRGISLAELQDRHAAVLLTPGVYAPRDIAIPGSGLDNVVMAMDYLTASNRHCLGDSVPAYDSGALNAAGKHVVVIGGGDTAMDCVRTAVRQQARSVRCLYRRDRANMPGSMREVENAEEEGVIFDWLSQPQAFLGDRHVDGIRVQHMRLGLPDASGRQTPEQADRPISQLPCDLAIRALGFDPEDLPEMFDCPSLSTSRWGTLRINFETMETSLPGVFAAGDAIRGASLVVWAIKDGHDAAAAIHAKLQAAENKPALERASA